VENRRVFSSEILFFVMLLLRDGVADGPSSGTTMSGDHDSYGPRILAACWVVGVLSSVVLGLRMYCKVKRSRQPWHDDYVLIAAWVGVPPSHSLFQSRRLTARPDTALPDNQHRPHHRQRLARRGPAPIQLGSISIARLGAERKRLGHLVHHRRRAEQDIVRHHFASADYPLHKVVCLVPLGYHECRSGPERCFHLGRPDSAWA